MATFQKLSDRYDDLTAAEKVNLFKSTSVSDEATLDNLKSIGGKFKILIYEEN